MIAFFSAPADLYSREVVQGELDGYSLHVLDLETGEEREVAPPTAFLFANAPPAWSPQGDSIAFCGTYDWDKRFQIHIVGTNGEGLRTLRAQIPYRAVSVVWPTPNHIISHWQREVFVVDLLNGSISPICTVEYGIGAPLSLSPDRRFILLSEIHPYEPITTRVITITGEEPREDLSEQLFDGAWRLTSRPASP